MKKFKIILIIVIAVVIITGILIAINLKDKGRDLEFTPIKSKADLNKVLATNEGNSILKNILTLPLSGLRFFNFNIGYRSNINYGPEITDSGISMGQEGSIGKTTTDSVPKSTSEYSNTNIQVENVDEADVVKTDGEYIYSISGSIVVVTKTDKEGKLSIVSKISTTGTPQDILINKNKLIVISYTNSNSALNDDLPMSSGVSSSIALYPYYDQNNTLIEIYDIQDKAKINKIKEVKLDKKYYTSRMIENKIYVLTSGYIIKRLEDYVLPSYSIDGKISNIAYNKINYMRGKKTPEISMIATVDLSNLETGIDINGYLMPINNAYISENNMYLAFEKYKNDNSSNSIGSLFTLKGILGFFDNLKKNNENDNSGTYTTIVKFKFVDNGIEYLSKAEEKGTTLNQFSLDEYGSNLRVTLSDGTKNNKLIVLSKEMKKIGEITNIAKGEKIYSTRFVGDRAYMVTYKTMDPLFVIDLADPTMPKILGELKIPGYSTYIHPYDENHIIGIGNDTKEEIQRDTFGRVIWQRAYITGMKMSIFDVTDVKNPKEEFSQKIGDSSTYSSILTNHKALLFSKDKELIAIPINNYKNNILIETTTGTISDISSNISSVEKIKEQPVGTGYIVYNINLKDGFKEKGTISHDTKDSNQNYWYGNSNGVRGIYIDNMLYTISEKYIKAHTLDKLEEKSNIEIEK